MQPILDEIIEKAAQLSDAERRELIQLLQEQEKKSKSKNSLSISSVSVLLESNNKKNPDSNIEWLKKHQSEYAGNYVALKDGEFVAFGKTIKDAELKAREKGVKKPLLHYIPAKDEEVWGGW
ncbi:MAG TPA: DUF5678 domain-containing protein [Pyrinomonadaceae bacterium]|jgi:hypothetical protein